MFSRFANGRGEATTGGSTEGTDSGVRGLVRAQSTRMNKELAAEYGKLFTKMYAKKDVPPAITMDDLEHKLPYQENTKIFKTSTHIGQRKLFNTELEFFVDKLPANKQVVCLYAGAAPSNHTGYLSKLFPNVKFILVDPNPFDIFEAEPVMLESIDPIEDIDIAVKGNAKIYIINDIMTTEIAEAVKAAIPRDELFFISDIRTSVSDAEPDTIDILWNLSQQYNWMTIMSPSWSMLKFRHPFYAENIKIFEQKCAQSPYKEDFEMSKTFGIDFIENHKAKVLEYWAGTINLQTFAGPSSTETRLITDSLGTHMWGTAQDYDDKLFFYNSIYRCYTHHFNDNADWKLGFDHCNCCAKENYLWKKYKEAYSCKTSVRDLVAKLSQITKRSLIRDNHGRFFDKKYPLESLIRAAKTVQRDSKARPMIYGKR